MSTNHEWDVYFYQQWKGTVHAPTEEEARNAAWSEFGPEDDDTSEMGPDNLSVFRRT